MSVLTRIAELSVEDVQEAIRTTLRGGLNQNFLLDFVASVDWGGAPGRPEVRDLLGRIELWATEYDEYDLSLAQYLARLISILPASERPLFSLRVFVGDASPIAITGMVRSRLPQAPLFEEWASPQTRPVAEAPLPAIA